jgi:hypothetical protein
LIYETIPVIIAATVSVRLLIDGATYMKNQGKQVTLSIADLIRTIKVSLTEANDGIKATERIDISLPTQRGAMVRLKLARAYLVAAKGMSETEANSFILEHGYLAVFSEACEMKLPTVNGSATEEDPEPVVLARKITSLVEEMIDEDEPSEKLRQAMGCLRQLRRLTRKGAKVAVRVELQAKIDSQCMLNYFLALIITAYLHDVEGGMASMEIFLNGIDAMIGQGLGAEETPELAAQVEHFMSGTDEEPDSDQPCKRFTPPMPHGHDSN